ncbi:Neurogenic locus notch-like protein 1 [Holothuria leucospilota]|uniref:Neurogenic locus notch-like protein 1 n=1 Tax=Holothuria leucospilota TaxID=206669 RepID=A0A9Q1HDE1_HOLLE|nr:Neurogenic locus notch-like protein 1 [Holothuria leucospilota]
MTVEGLNSPPVITCPAPVVVTSLANNVGNNAAWDPPTCVDAEDGTITTSVCVPASGSFFSGVGVNTVTCTCTDSGGLSDQCTFPVTIQGFNTPPVITCPAPVVVTSLANNVGNSATWDPPTCVDAEDGTITTSVCVPASGSFFTGVGVNTVTCTCTDSGGLSDECTFPVSITGINTAPVITCPDPVVVTSLANNVGNIASWAAPTCVDAEDGTITTSVCVPASGSFFPGVAVYTVTCTCTDSGGLSDECTFPVTVEVQTACNPNPCQNGGACSLQGISGFICTCASGFTGVTCGQVQTACNPNPCINGGVCNLVGLNSFSCNCPAVFIGTRCEQVQTACNPNPCQNGGACSLQGINGFICTCASGFMGATCGQVTASVINCPAVGLNFLDSEVITWTEPTVSGGTLISQTHFPGVSQFPLGTTLVTYQFTVPGSPQLVTCDFSVTVTRDPNSAGNLLSFPRSATEMLQTSSSTMAAALSCTVETADGYTPEITWWRNNEVIQSGNGYYFTGDREGLLILPVTQADGGSYQCQAAIPSESVSITMDINLVLEGFN